MGLVQIQELMEAALELELNAETIVISDDEQLTNSRSYVMVGHRCPVCTCSTD